MYIVNISNHFQLSLTLKYKKDNTFLKKYPMMLYLEVPNTLFPYPCGFIKM